MATIAFMDLEFLVKFPYTFLKKSGNREFLESFVKIVSSSYFCDENIVSYKLDEQSVILDNIEAIFAFYRF